MGKYKPYSDPTILESIRAITKNVIQTVAPDEESSVQILTDKIVSDYEKNSFPLANNDSKRAGGLNNADLLTLIIVPVVTTVLETLSKQLFSKIFKRKSEEENLRISEMIDSIVEDEYIKISVRVKSKKFRSKKVLVSKVTKLYIKQVLDTEGLFTDGSATNDHSPAELSGDSTTNAPPPNAHKKNKKAKGK